MSNLTSIQISKEFKEILRREKNPEDTFEMHIKKLRDFTRSYAVTSIDQSIESIEQSIEKKQEINQESDRYKDPILIKDKLGKVWKFPNPPIETHEHSRS